MAVDSTEAIAWSAVLRAAPANHFALASNSGKIYVTILRKNHRAKLCILAFAGQDEVCIF